MPTVSFYPDAHPEVSSADGYTMHAVSYLAGNGVEWLTLVDGAGTSGSASTHYGTAFKIYSHTYDANKWRSNRREIFLFDTSSLPDDCRILSATFSLYGYAKHDYLGIAPNVNVFGVAPASDTDIVAGDYASVGSTPYCDTPISYANWKTADPFWNDFILNAAGLAAISRIGVTKIATRNVNYDVDRVVPAWTINSYSEVWCYFADEGIGYKPKLTVTYGAATGIPGHGWVGGEKLRIIDENGLKRDMTGTIISGSGVVGHGWVQGTYLCWLEETTGKVRRREGTKVGATGITKTFGWVEGDYLHYIDDSQDERVLPYGALLGGEILNEVGFNE